MSDEERNDERVFDETVDALRRQCDADASDLGTRLRLGVLLSSHLWDQEEGREILKRLTCEHPLFADALYWDAHFTHFNTPWDDKRALELLERARLTLGKDTGAIVELRAYVLSELKLIEQDEYIRLLRAATDEEPNWVLNWASLAEALRAVGQDGAAEACKARALANLASPPAVGDPFESVVEQLVTGRWAELRSRLERT